MAIQRKDVVSYMLFLIIVMIIMNIFTIFTVWRADFEQKMRVQRQQQLDEFDHITHGPMAPSLQRRMDQVNSNYLRDGFVSLRFLVSVTVKRNMKPIFVQIC